MKVLSETLITDLINKTKSNLNQAEKLKLLRKETLNFKSSPESWSALECIKHLNLYADYYLPEIEARIKASKFKASSDFKSGVLGNYFAQMMLPKEKMKKMKTPKDKNPIGSNINVGVIQDFIEQQYKILTLLDESRVMDLNKTKTSISISKMIKLKLGDTFRFVINHNERHLMQANNVIETKPD